MSLRHQDHRGFDSKRHGLADGQAKTFVVSIAGGERREIRPDFSAVQRPVWSPDGRRLIVWGVAPGEGPPGDRADFWVTGLERDRALQAVPMGRVGRPEDVAALTGFLFSPAAGYITRQVIGVNGGMI